MKSEKAEERNLGAGAENPELGAENPELGAEKLPGGECAARLTVKEASPQGESAPRGGKPPRTRLFIGRLLEESEAAPLVTDKDRREAAAFLSAHRRREFLSWRAFLYRELGTPVNIAYEASGAPRITSTTTPSPLYIGVSHCLTHAAVCWSESRCAVDIELTDRNFERVRSRYLTPDEERLCSRPDWLCIAWCAKECLYKLAGEQGLDLLRDLHLHAATFFDEPHPICKPHQPGEPRPETTIGPGAFEVRCPDDNSPLLPLLTLGTLRGSIRDLPTTLHVLSLGPVRIVLSE